MGHFVSYFNWLSVMTLKNKTGLCPILILQGFIIKHTDHFAVTGKTRL